MNLASAGKIAKETDLAESKEQLDVLDNQIDQQTKAMEIESRKRDADMKYGLEQQKLRLKIAEMGHEHIQNIAQRDHEKQLKEQEATIRQQSQIKKEPE